MMQKSEQTTFIPFQLLLGGNLPSEKGAVGIKASHDRMICFLQIKTNNALPFLLGCRHKSLMCFENRSVPLCYIP